MEYEKKLLEEYAVSYFLSELNRIEGQAYVINKHLDKPDFLVNDRLTGEEIGIEVTHLFYDPEEAKMLLDRPRKFDHGSMDIHHLIDRLNRLIQQKAQKAPDYLPISKTILLVRVASPVFDKEDFDRLEQEIIVPENIFWQIWLLFRNSSDVGWGDLKRLK